MSDYNNGQIWGWNGGECPVHPKSEVTVWLRGESGSFCRFAEYLRWSHQVDDSDIVCFQVTKQYAEPKVIYVNENKKSGYLQAYISAEAAQNNAQPYHTSIAAKYVEVKE